MRHVCLISTEILGWGKAGGYGFVVRMIGTELIKRGYRVTVIIPKPRDVVEDSTLLDGIEVRSYPRLAFSEGMALFREADADIYHSHEPSLGGWLAMRAMPHRKHIVTNQDPRLLRDWWIEFKHPTYSPFQVLKTAAYYDNLLHRPGDRSAPLIGLWCRAVSEESCGREVRPRHRADLHADAEPCSAISEQGRDADRFCYLGRLDRRKQPERFLDLAAEFPGVQFDLRRRSPGQALRRLSSPTVRRAAEPGVSPVYDQFRDTRVSDILAKSWVLINTSAREGLPNTYMEAAGHRCAILSAVDPDGFASRFGHHAPNGDFEAANSRRRRPMAGGGVRGWSVPEYVNQTYEVGKAIDRQVALYDEIGEPRVKVLMTGPSLTHRNQGDNLLYFVVGDIVRAHYDGNVEITAFSATEEPGRIGAQAPWLHIVNPRKDPLRAISVLFGAKIYFIAGAIPFHDNFRLMLQQFLYALVVKMRGENSSSTP